ncbi:MAG: kelch repeat-containing protein [Saprospiraceae bacterium]|nr:kelch repeat-containing protein [Saprospiraceae bacterium]
MTKKILVLLSLHTILGCSTPKLDTLDFVDTIVLSPSFENFNAATLRGQILHQGATVNGECGFIWSYDRAAVEDSKPGAIMPVVQKITQALPAVGGGSFFEMSLGNLERGRSIYIRTFVVIHDEGAGERSIFSTKTETFDIGEIVVNTGNALILNNSAVVFGQLRGIAASGKSVEHHGHVISKKNEPVPTIGCTDCKTSTKDSSNDDEVFHSEFDSLEFNTTYYVRAYAIANNLTFYSKNVDTFRVRDGWELIDSFPDTYAEGTAAVLDGIAYAGFGCRKALGCLQGDLSADFRKFDPAAQNGLGEWTASVPLPSQTSITLQYNDVSFVVGGRFHAMCGGIGDMFGNLQNNLIFWDPNTQLWDLYFNTIPGPKRTGAVAFTLKGKAYVGTGRDVNYEEFNDFWEYNPVTNQWRPVASMPMQFNPLEPAINKGRQEAVAFTINDNAYVGSGRYGNLDLRDFWRFIPPMNDQDPGQWEQVAFLPPEAPGRYQAVAMSINDKGYVGTGYNATLGYLNDWWQYDPIANSWLLRTALPAPARTNAMGFTIDQRGYLGTGHTRILINGGQSSTEITLSDFWRYVPEE